MKRKFPAPVSQVTQQIFINGDEAFGPIAPLMTDPDITEIMINDSRTIFVEKNGHMEKTNLRFSDENALNNLVSDLIDTFAPSVGEAASPILDISLPDGSRAHIVRPPLTSPGPCITIRRFPKVLGSVELLQSKTLSKKVGFFLNACTQGRLNMLVSGGTGSGKTTLLNVLMASIPRNERLIVIEETPELTLQNPNFVRLQTQLKSLTSPGTTLRELIASSMRMRPDRIVIGECRGGESLDMLQAMNTGHEGSMTTLHANSPRDALVRLETLCLMSGIDIPLNAIRKQIISAIDLVIHLKRFRESRRRVVAISEVTGAEGDVITMQDIFSYDTKKDSVNTTGFVPSLSAKLTERGVEIPADFFATS